MPTETNPSGARRRRLLSRPVDLGLLEYAARIALVPLVLFGAWVTWRSGWRAAGGAWAGAVGALLLAPRWRKLTPGLLPRCVCDADPGVGLGPLSKLAMIGALVLAPFFLRDGEWLVAIGLVVMALASAGLWLRWRWALWAWIAYAVATMGDWLLDAARLFGTAARTEGPFPMEQVKPLLVALPSALFALAVVSWVLEWHGRTFGAGARSAGAGGGLGEA